jgi:hypothetical protein
MPHVQACIAYSCSCPAEATTHSRSKAYSQILIIVAAFFLLLVIRFVFSTLVDDDELMNLSSQQLRLTVCSV